MDVRRWALGIERRWDARRVRRRSGRPPEHLRIDTYLGYGGPGGVVVGGRLLDDPPLTVAVHGEGVGAAVRRNFMRFLTHDLPGVALRVTLEGTSIETVTDDDGYFMARFPPTTTTGPWLDGTVELATEYRGLTDLHTTPFRVLVPGPDARFGIVSDIDDTILETGVQRVWQMVRTTFTGSALTRTPFPGAPELYRDLAAGVNPVFYVSSSPWNLYAFLQGFLRHRDFPIGPVLLRDLIGTEEGRARKHERIEDIIARNPQLQFVLLGDSGEHDPQVYADMVRAHPDRFLAVYIREVRLDPGDGRVEQVSDSWASEVPFVLAADSDAVRRHAESIGLL
jgi:phosphatidate phosphatase APP1